MSRKEGSDSKFRRRQEISSLQQNAQTVSEVQLAFYRWVSGTVSQGEGGRSLQFLQMLIMSGGIIQLSSCVFTQYMGTTLNYCYIPILQLIALNQYIL